MTIPQQINLMGKIKEVDDPTIIIIVRNQQKTILNIKQAILNLWPETGTLWMINWMLIMILGTKLSIQVWNIMFVVITSIKKLCTIY